jgi:hypothetical protein
MQKLLVRKEGKKYLITLLGMEYELILPEEKNVSKKKKTGRKTTSKVVSKATAKDKKEVK